MSSHVKGGLNRLMFDVDTIDHQFQRYPTVGDYHTDAFGYTSFRVSDLNNKYFELCVAVHEIVEKYLCEARGIKEEDIDAFDIQYENSRIEGDVSEPGDCKVAPYYDEHQFATKIEKLLAEELGIDWSEYEEAINKL